MKEMSKARIITKRSVKSVMNERMILALLKNEASPNTSEQNYMNPFLVNMYYAF